MFVDGVPAAKDAVGARAGHAHCLPEQEQDAGRGTTQPGAARARGTGRRQTRAARTEGTDHTRPSQLVPCGECPELTVSVLSPDGVGVRAVRGGARRAHAPAARAPREGARALRQRERTARLQVLSLYLLLYSLNSIRHLVFSRKIFDLSAVVVAIFIGTVKCSIYDILSRLIIVDGLQCDGDRGRQPGGLRRGGAVSVGLHVVAGTQQLVRQLRGRLAVVAPAPTRGRAEPAVIA